MNTYEVREHNVPNKASLRVTALTPKGAIENLLRDGRWYTINGVTELIDVTEVQGTPDVYALTATGEITRTI